MNGNLFVKLVLNSSETRDRIVSSKNEWTGTINNKYNFSVVSVVFNETHVAPLFGERKFLESLACAAERSDNDLIIKETSEISPKTLNHPHEMANPQMTAAACVAS